MTGTPEPVAGRWPPSARLEAGVGDPAGDPLPRQSIPNMLADVIADIGGIVRAEVQLGRDETVDNARAFAGAAVQFASGLLLVALAATFGTVALVVALAKAIGLLWALLSVTLLCLVAAAVLVMAARRSVASRRLLPEQTLHRVADDLDRLAQRTGATALSGAQTRKEAGSHA